MNPPTIHWRKSSHSDHQGGECVEVADLTPAIIAAAHWHKSSHSDHHGGECVEVAHLTPAIIAAAQWHKSSRSDQHGGACVEIAHLQSVIAVRDSKDPNGPTLAFDAAAWRAFAHQIKVGRHDLS